MAELLLASRLVLAAIFLVAAVAKLLDRAALRSTLRAFHAPERLVAPGAWTLPLTELAVATLLVPAATAGAAAVAALVLLVVFCGGIVHLLARGERPDCSCFGRVSSTPVGWTTLLRNVCLAAGALVVASRPAPPPAWPDTAIAGGVAVLLAQAWLWLELLRRYGRMLRRVAELEQGASPGAGGLIEQGAAAPPFVLPDLGGVQVSLDDLLRESPEVVLLFTDPGCGACDRALREAGELGESVVAVSTGSRQDVATRAADHGLERVLLDERREVAALYGVTGVPTALVVDADGAVFGDPAVGSGEVAALLGASARTPGGVG